MKLSFLFSSILLVQLYSFSVSAQVQCSEIYEARHPLEIIYEEGPMGGLEMAKKDFVDARTQTEANHAIHNLVVMSNRVMDVVMDQILQLNFMELSPHAKAQKSEVVGHLIEQLQQTFKIGNNAMEAAINNRMNIEVTELQAKSEAAEVRQAIGFERNESSASFHSDVAEARPVGFVRAPRKVREQEAEEARVKEMEEAIREMVEFEEPVAPTPSNPIGFVLPKAETHRPAPRQPIGFGREKVEADSIDPGKLDQLLFDIETGLFEFIKNQNF